MSQSNTLLNALMFQSRPIPQINLNADYVHQGFFKREESDRERGGESTKQKIERLIGEGLSNHEIAEKLSVRQGYVSNIRYILFGSEIKKTVRKIVQLTLDGEYITTHDNQVDAVLSIGQRSACCIGKVCKGVDGRRSAYGYIWMFLEDYEKLKGGK